MIRGRTIHLRVIQESDLDAVLASENDLARRGDFVINRLRAEPAFRKEFQETGFLTEEAGKLLVVDGEDRVLGNVGYFRPEPYMDGYELGFYAFDPARRGQGITTEAVGLLVDWLFSTKKINRLQLGILTENTASKRVAEKSGFRFEGVLRGAIFLRGGNHDLEMWSLLRSEWEARRKSEA